MKSTGLRSVVGVLVLFAIIMIVLGIVSYNNIKPLNESVQQSWSQVENQYQKRSDLIPNLVNAIKGYDDFERSVLTGVIEARAKVSQMNVTPEVLNDPQAFQRFQQLQGELSSSLTKLLVTVENYPTLKASEKFHQLQTQLKRTENKISAERRNFNQKVQTYNTTIKKFPASIFTGIFGFGEKQYFAANPGTETTP